MSLSLSQADSRRIQDYLADSMSTTESQQFMRDCAADPNLAGELAVYQSVQQVLQNQEALAFRRKLEERIAQQQALVDVGPNKASWPWGRHLLLLLSVVIILGTMLFLLRRFSNSYIHEHMNKQEIPLPSVPLTDSLDVVPPPIAKEVLPAESPERLKFAKGNSSSSPAAQPSVSANQETAYRQLAMSEYQPITFVLRGPSMDAQSTSVVKKVFDNYAQVGSLTDSLEKQQQLEKVLMLLNSTETGKDERLLLTRAQAYFETGGYEQAISDFKVLRNSFAYEQDADWGIVLCYLVQMPEQEKALQQVMDSIMNNKNHAYRQKLLALAEQLALIKQ